MLSKHKNLNAISVRTTLLRLFVPPMQSVKPALLVLETFSGTDLYMTIAQTMSAEVFQGKLGWPVIGFRGYIPCVGSA